jgi:hypothetical protein
MLQRATAAGPKMATRRRHAGRAGLDDLFEATLIVHLHNIARRRERYKSAIFGDTIAGMTELEDAKRRTQAIRLTTVAAS